MLNIRVPEKEDGSERNLVKDGLKVLKSVKTDQKQEIIGLIKYFFTFESRGIILHFSENLKTT